MEMEVILERKMVKLLKSWAPVLMLMGLLIAVDTLDSMAGGQSLLSLVKHSHGFGSWQYHHLQLPCHSILPCNAQTAEEYLIIRELTQLRKGRRKLLQPKAGPN